MMYAKNTMYKQKSKFIMSLNIRSSDIGNFDVKHEVFRTMIYAKNIRDSEKWYKI